MHGTNLSKAVVAESVLGSCLAAQACRPPRLKAGVGRTSWLM